MKKRPSELEIECLRACRELDLGGQSLLVAVSGGVDSVVLLHVLAAAQAELGIRLGAAHVHHGLRGDAADEDEQFVADLSANLEIPFHSRRVDPERLREDRASRERPTLQEAARQVRRNALIEMAEAHGAKSVVTAHQRDDQVETVLMRLFRGTSPEGLGGIAERSPDGWFARPLLGVSREAIEAFALERGIGWREDASNADPRYRRNLVRQRLGGLATELNPGWERAIAALAESQRRESEWAHGLVGTLAEEWLRESDDSLILKGEGWAHLAPAAARRLLRLAWHRVGGGRDVTRSHLDRARAFLASPGPGSRLEWPGGWILERRRSDFHLWQRTPAERESAGRRLKFQDGSDRTDSPRVALRRDGDPADAVNVELGDSGTGEGGC